MKSYLGQSQLPRGIRNNNPGNLVLTNIQWLGKVPNAQNTDGHFEQFTSIEYGIRAMAMDIINDIKKGKNTLSALINEYAPSFENNTAAYIQMVSEATGIGANDFIPNTTGSIAAIIKAKLIVENGSVVTKYITDTDIAAGLDLVNDKWLQKKSLYETIKNNWIVYALLLILVVALILFILN